VLYVVQAAIVGSRQEALSLSATLTRAGFSSYIVPVNGKFAVRLGAFREQQNALRLARQATARGFDVVILPLSPGPRR
jgi:cell division septation protein DedD